MLKLMNKKQKTTTNKGFSLVELIVVIAIMAVLVAVLAPAMLRYVENSRKSKDAQAVAGLVTTTQAAIIDNAIGAGDYIITVTGTNCTVSSNPTNDTAEAAIESALSDAYGANWSDDITLESNTWGSTGNNVEVTFTITNSGATTVTYTSTQADDDEAFDDYIGETDNNDDGE